MQSPVTPYNAVMVARTAALRRGKNVGVVPVSIDHLRPKPGPNGAPPPVTSFGNLLDIDAVCRKCGGRSKAWLYRLMQADLFVPGIYIGRSLFIPEQWVDHWIAAQAVSQLGFGQAEQVASQGVA